MVTSAKDCVLAIDPGKTGAICVMSIQPKLIAAIHDIPIREDKSGICLSNLGMLLDMYRDKIKLCAIERVSAMVYTDKSGKTRGQGAAASFNFGKGFGEILGMLSAFNMPTLQISPSVWKLALGLNSEKKNSIQLAKRLYPEIAHSLTLKKHDGRAEAILLAHFAIEKFGRAR